MTVKTRTRQHDHSVILLDRTARRAAAFAGLNPRIVSSVAELRSSVAQATRDSIWVSYASDLTDALLKRAVSSRSPLGTGVFIHAIDVKSIPALASMFRRIAYAVDGGFIAAEELAEVLKAPNREDLLIGGFVNAATQTITFWRGNFDSLTVPLATFRKSGDGTEPNFESVSVIDCGQTVRLGKYEAAVDAILYEHDTEYRRRRHKQRLRDEQTFGASLRRLRKQRGLRREDFQPDLAAKTVARIEQGKVRRVQKHTLDSLAKHLSVQPQEIASF